MFARIVCVLHKTDMDSAADGPLDFSPVLSSCLSRVLTSFYKKALSRCVAGGIAAEGGQLETLKWFLETRNSCKTAAVAAAAAAKGNLDCLKLALEKGCFLDATVLAAAADRGDLDCLQFLIEHNCPWDCNAPARAACNGHLAALQFLRNGGCRWDLRTTGLAARNGKLACLQYAVEQVGLFLKEEELVWHGRNIHRLMHAHTH